MIRTPNDRKTRRDDLLRDKFDHDAPLFTGSWICTGMLGGGMADAALWIQLNEDETVLSRVVRKDTHLSAGEWTDASRWAGDPKTPAGRVPLEYHCQKKVQESSEARNAVQASKCEVDVKRLQYRLYSHYCPYGDLGGFIKRNARNKPIPEAWIWMVFAALVDCGLIMERGGIEELPDEQWKQVVHRDLKPANTFLDLEDADSWPLYPKPRLGDFGLAFETWEDDELNPLIWNRNVGTRGFKAPEQCRFIGCETREPVHAFQLLAHTNVWGVGMIIWSLVHKFVPSSGNQPSYLPGGIFEYSMHRDLKKAYSAELVSMIADCIKFDPAARPSFAQLRDRIETFIAGEEGVYDSLPLYIQSARDGVQEVNDGQDLLGVPPERDMIGMAFQHLPLPQ